MSDSSFPPPYWFAAAEEIIADAKKHLKIQDFKVNAKLKPYKIGESYSYRIDVLQQLISDGVIFIVDESMHVGGTDNIIWMTKALKEGFSAAWDFVESVEGIQPESIKFDQKTLKEIGDSGELFVIENLKKKLPTEYHKRIIHIAKKDDSAGFDIYSPSLKNTEHNYRLEVKTSTRALSNGVQFFISRNEFEIGRIHRNWCIVFVSITEGEKKILGHIYCYQIESRLPKDVDETAKWQNCKVFVENELLRYGLP